MAEPLINQLFDSKKANLIREIYKEDLSDSAKISVKKYIGEEVTKSDKIILGHELDQLILINSLAPFIQDDEEPLTISVMLWYCLKQQDILPSLLEHRGKAFASRSLVSLSLFLGAMKQRHNKGAPSPEYYQKVAIVYLKQENLNAVSNNFDKWKSFIFERFTV